MNQPRTWWRRLRGWMMGSLPMMLTCRHADELLDDYLDGALPGPQRRRLEWHLRLCRACRRYLAAYRRTVELIHGVHREAPPVPEDLLRGIVSAAQAQALSRPDPPKDPP